MLGRSYVDPFWTLFDRLDRLSARTPGSGSEDGGSLLNGIPINLFQDQNNYYLQAWMPGLSADQLELTWNQHTLTISSSVSPDTPEGATPLYQELRPYRFRRSIQLNDVDVENVEARIADGVLLVVAPKAEQKRTRVI